MTSRRRKEHDRFDLQRDTVGFNGTEAYASLDDMHVPAQAQAADNLAGAGFVSAQSQSSPTGRIEVSPRAIAHIASRAAQRSYGVVGLVPRHSRPGWAELLRREEAHRGVEVSFPDGHVLIELYVVIEYGTRISEVARNIMSNVKFAVESALGVSVVQVNVNVQNIRVSEGK